MTMISAVTAGGTKAGVILTGALRDVYSKEILLAAQPNLVFSQFVDKRTELGREPGDTIKFTKYNDLRGASLLSEVENIATTHLSASMVSIGVAEHGFAVAESERLLRTSWDDVMGRATALLGQHYGRAVDGLCRTELHAAGALQDILVNNRVTRATIVAGDKLDVVAIKDGIEILAVNKTSKINGAWVCIIHPHQSRGLRDSAYWLEAHKYAAPDAIFRGEIGMLEGVRFIETTNTRVIKTATGAVFADGVNTGEAALATFSATVDVYQSVLMGANAVGWAEALPVQFRDGGIKDFGRTVELAWYSIMGAGAIRPENIVQIETA